MGKAGRMVNDHEILTSGIHGLTGTLVGTTDTQTLTNKTITSPTISGATITGSSTIPSLTAQSVDGAVTITPGVNWITKAGVAALSVAAPSSQDGVILHFVSTTANAHVITFTGATLQNGVTAGRTTATLANVAGASITVIAKGVLWYVVSQSAAVTYA